MNHPSTQPDMPACHGIPTDVFFPGPGDSAGIAAARRICAECPVAEACRQWAVDNDETGIWGGTTGRQRAKLRTGRRVSHYAAVRGEAVMLLNTGAGLGRIAAELGIHKRTVQRYRDAAKAAA